MSDHDDKLAQLLADLSDRAHHGEVIDIQLIGYEHPEYAAELQELWGAAMLADAVGSQCQRFDDTAVPSKAKLTLELPYYFGDFELVEEIGRGGMGIVYKAHQSSLDRLVAIKMILAGEYSSSDDQARFRAEAEAAARLDHPGIVPVYEVGEHQGRSYFSMKYIEGMTLSQKLGDGPLPSRPSAQILATVAHAIHFAHLHGVLHRDLKPSNVLIDIAGQAHITDFGLAKRIDRAIHETGNNNQVTLTHTGQILGTPAYMAPEQATGQRGEIGPFSDVYGLGAILYHMLTGRPPFQAASPVDTMIMVLEQDLVPPRVINPIADRDLEMIATRCLQKPPDLRYENAGALADDLDAYLNDEPISARSGRFGHVINRFFRETHHATILENWGLLWMWHSLALLIVCLMTNCLYWNGVTNRWYYFLMWTVGLGTWAAIFWALRRRMGPVTFVERQIAHVWAASMIGIGMLFPIEYLLELDVLRLSPMLALTNGMVFLVKAGILSGSFYIQAVMLFLSAAPMAIWPDYAPLIFGIISAACFFFPGLKYYRRRARFQ